MDFILLLLQCTMASKLKSPSSRLAFPRIPAIFASVFISAIHINVQAQDFDFFYFVQQWPGSYCNTEAGCCYPRSGKPPSDFSIHGLWPNYNNGGYPSNCDSSNPFDPSQIRDLRWEMNSEWPSLACPSRDGNSFWAHEWNKHGTCSESIMDQHDYFQAALRLKDGVDLLGALKNAGINPDGSQYSLDSVQGALTRGAGHTPGIECNRDESGNKQLYQIYICVDKSGSNIINCPVLPATECSSQTIIFPSF